MESEAEAGRAFLRARRWLAVELPPLVGAGALLYLLAPATEAEGSPLDARALYLVCFTLFSMALLGCVGRVLEVLEFECPRCRESFCAGLLLRSRCANCGFRPAAEAPPEETAGADPSR
jgi:hypothetical protein